MGLLAAHNPKHSPFILLSGEQGFQLGNVLLRIHQHWACRISGGGHLIPQGWGQTNSPKGHCCGSIRAQVCGFPPQRGHSTELGVLHQRQSLFLEASPSMDLLNLSTACSATSPQLLHSLPHIYSFLSPKLKPSIMTEK